MALRNARAEIAALKYAGVGLCAILSASCASNVEKPVVLGESGGDYRDAIGVYSNPEAEAGSLDPIAAAATWGTRYSREPENPEVAVAYSASLRKIGSVKEAVSVMTKVAQRHPEHAGVNLETGKALIEDGRAFEAIRYIENAIDYRKEDWRALSAYGVALDQIGEHELAREQYDAALLMSPDAVSVLSNKGLSYVLSGDLDRAVQTLRAATANRRGDARVRQNLALVLAIKGDMREAEKLARSDLPPQVADNNVQYFRSLMTQPAYWAEYASDDIDVPTFDAPVAVAPAAEFPTAPVLLVPSADDVAAKDEPVAEPVPATPVTDASADAPDIKQPAEF